MRSLVVVVVVVVVVVLSRALARRPRAVGFFFSPGSCFARAI
jgi:hypothetical protein